MYVPRPAPITPRARRSVTIVGAGVFGATAAVEFCKRGYSVVIVSPQGMSTSPLAASYDISKLIRSVYGSDEEYTSMMKEALPLWREWNKQWGVGYFHDTGLLGITKDKVLNENAFLYGGYQMLEKNEMRVEQLSSQELSKRYPQWNSSHYRCGMFTPDSGWAESSNVVNNLLRMAHFLGATIVHGRVSKLNYNDSSDGHVNSYTLEDGRHIRLERGEQVVVAAGAWTRNLLPRMKPLIRGTGQVVFHFRVPTHLIPAYMEDRFPGYVADTDTTGFYGFPCLPDGVLKIGNHGPGYPMEHFSEADIEANLKRVRQRELAKFRAFMARSLPQLKDAPVIYSRMCMYCDSFDGDFIIDWHPDVANVFVATGGSGHGFKFAPLLGQLIADGLERKYNQYLSKFSWREPSSSPTKGGAKEQSRAFDHQDQEHVPKSAL